MSSSQDGAVCVSIVMPTYNSGAFAAEAIESVLAQTFPEWELLVVDDGSTDSTADVVRRYENRDSRVRAVFLGFNAGAAKARNVAIGQSRGRYVAFLDSDDLWRPHKLEAQLRLFAETGAPLVYSAYEKIDAEGRREGRVVTVPDRIDYAGLLKETVIATVTAMFDTEKVGRMLMPDIRKRQDYALWLKILRMGGEARGVNDPLAFLRKRPGSLSSNKLSAAMYVWQVYRDIEKLSLRDSVYHFSRYALHAFRKSRI